MPKTIEFWERRNYNNVMKMYIRPTAEPLAYIKWYLTNFKPYKNGAWCYEDGIILAGAEALFHATDDQSYFTFITTYLDQAIGDDGQLPRYNLTDFNIDNINCGKLLLSVYLADPQPKFYHAINRLVGQLGWHPRTSDGNWFHKARYPHQVWCDGLYMAPPFIVRYARDFLQDPTPVYQDIANQFYYVRKRLFDPSTHLYMHAYDELKVMPWADKTTGRSPHCWSRAVGWLALALVDCASYGSEELKLGLKDMLVELLDGLIPYFDARSGLLYQVVDRPGEEGNYVETSGSAMIATACLRGYRLGLLDSKYRDLGFNIWIGIKNLMFLYRDGQHHLINICQVAGLDDKQRDGSYRYYLSEPVVADEAKGVAPFMMLVAEIIFQEKKHETIKRSY